MPGYGVSTLMSGMGGLTGSRDTGNNTAPPPSSAGLDMENPLINRIEQYVPGYAAMDEGSRRAAFKRAFDSGKFASDPYLMSFGNDGKLTGEPKVWKDATETQHGFLSKVVGTIGDVVKTVAPAAALVPGVGALAAGALGAVGGAMGTANDENRGLGSIVGNAAGSGVRGYVGAKGLEAGQAALGYGENAAEGVTGNIGNRIRTAGSNLFGGGTPIPAASSTPLATAADVMPMAIPGQASQVAQRTSALSGLGSFLKNAGPTLASVAGTGADIYGANQADARSREMLAENRRQSDEAMRLEEEDRVRRNRTNMLGMGMNFVANARGRHN